MESARRASLREVAAPFLRLGLTAFGGPAAHIAMMEDEVVRRRRWLDRQDFLDMLGAVNLVPGPNSTEMAIFIGYRQVGWPGLALGGLCFILPAALVTLAFAWAYVRFGALPRAAGLLYGMKPVVIAVVLQALWGLGKTALKDSGLAVIAALSAAANALGLGKLFLVFLKVGAVLFGSGYVLLAFLRADLVGRLHWLSPAQLLDAVAVGQFTPGPVFTTATFIGYLLGGLPGAGAATAGIFLPGFVFIAGSGLLVPRLRASPGARAFLDGVNAASLSLMAVVAAVLARAAVVDLKAVALCLVSLVLLVRFRWSSAWLIVAGGLVGLLAA